MRCPLAQGFHFARPGDPERIDEKLGLAEPAAYPASVAASV